MVSILSGKELKTIYTTQFQFYMKKNCKEKRVETFQVK